MIAAATSFQPISTHKYLTSQKAGSSICRKELKNSESTAVSAPVSIAVFLCLLNECTDVFYVGRQQRYNTRKGKAAGRTVDRFLTSRHLGAALKNVSPRFKISSTGDVSMPHGAPSTPGNPCARQISLAFGLIADTLDWPNHDYQAFIARLIGTGVSPLGLTLGDVLTAYTAQCAARRGEAASSTGSMH